MGRESQGQPHQTHALCTQRGDEIRVTRIERTVLPVSPLLLLSHGKERGSAALAKEHVGEGTRVGSRSPICLVRDQTRLLARRSFVARHYRLHLAIEITNFSATRAYLRGNPISSRSIIAALSWISLED